MTLTPPLCIELFKTMFAIFSSVLEPNSFAMCASKFSYVFSSSVSISSLRKANEAIPSDPSSSFRYKYSQHTAITNLRRHIENYHLELYLTLAKENLKGWEISLPGLVRRARMQAANEAATVQEQPDDL
jgi:hypothetical protein